MKAAVRKLLLALRASAFFSSGLEEARETAWTKVNKCGQADELGGTESRVKEIIKQERTYDMSRWRLLACAWIFTILLVFARGGKGADSLFGFVYCGSGYWTTTAIALLALVALSMYIVYQLACETETKLSIGYDFAEGDVVWTRSVALRLSLGTLSAGIVAGLIGIGGGMVVGPFLLELGFIPQVSSAITATNVLMSSSTVAVLVLVSGVVPVDECMFFFGCCLTGAYLGKFYLGRAINKTGRTSIIILLLGCTITLSILAVLVNGITTWVTTDALQEEFSGVCS